jgi:hypothetical protein
MASSVKRGLMGIGTLVAAGAVRMETMVLSQRSDVAWAAFGAVTLMGLGLGWVWGSKQRAAFLGIIAGAISLVGIITVVLWRGPWWFDGKYLAKADWVSGAGPLVTGFRTTVVQLLIAVGAGELCGTPIIISSWLAEDKLPIVSLRRLSISVLISVT